MGTSGLKDLPGNSPTDIENKIGLVQRVRPFTQMKNKLKIPTTEEERKKLEEKKLEEWSKAKHLVLKNPVADKKMKTILKKFVCKGETYSIKVTKEKINVGKGLKVFGLCEPDKKQITLLYHSGIDRTYLHEIIEAVVAESGYKFETANEREQLVCNLEDGISSWMKQTYDAFKPKSKKKKLRKKK